MTNINDKYPIATKAIEAVKAVRAGVLEHCDISGNSEINAFVEISDPGSLSSDDLIDLAEKAAKAARLDFIRVDARDQGEPAAMSLFSALAEITELAAIAIKLTAKFENLDRRVGALEKKLVN